MQECFTNRMQKKGTLVFVYYSGHGACDNETYLILNEDGKMFAMEKMLRILSEMDNTYVIALYDCCREKVDISKWRGNNVSSAQGVDLGALF